MLTPRDASMEGGGPVATDVPPVELTVGPEGATVRLGDLRVQVPPGALGAPTAIRVTATNEPAPAGYRAFSRVYRFEPEGTTFAQPVTVTLPFTGDARLATVFWSRSPSEGGGYERLGGVPSGGTVSVTVTHFSTGFVADGVDYTDTPDRTCARTRVLDTRFGTATGISSSVAVFFGAEDCLGRPMPDLAATDFTTVEDGAAVSSEGRPTILPAPGLQLFVTLSLDLSSSTQPVLPQVIGAARALVDQLAATRVPAQVAIEVFAGDPDPVVWQRATLDLDAVRARLDALSTFVPTDRSSTNLHGAVIRGVTNLEEAETAFERRNAGGAFARGYLVLFTDGADTAGRTTLEDAATAARRARNQVVTVGLRGADFGDAARVALQRLGGSAYVEVVDAAVLEREFRFLAARIAGQARATYVLGYCSPRRSGEHAVGVRVTGATRTAPGDNTDGRFDATGFGPGCTVEAFDRTTRCGAAQCGGLGCGACDDRSDTCSATRRGCVNNCLTAGRCGGATLTNALGYTQLCSDRAESTSCGGTCRNLTNDAVNCGACGTACALNQVCRSGVCAAFSCPSGPALIPRGTFMMGDADPLSWNAQPPHMVTLSAFCLDLTEVTVAAYRSCTAGGCTPPTTGTAYNWGVSGRDNHPINGVDWNQARAYCQSVGGDLPTEAQWEYAARGTDGRIYPWGDTTPTAQLCWNRMGTCVVQSFSSGNSPFGLFDMAGNVSEWTQDYYANYTSATVYNPTGPTSGYRRVCRGAAWYHYEAQLARAALRFNFQPTDRGETVGFRCARGAT